MLKIVQSASIPEALPTPPLMLTKAERDAESLKRYARFVIVVEIDGSTRVISNYRRLLAGEIVIPLIVVMCPIEISGHYSWVSALEIGYKRARPYQRVEHTQTRELLLKNRDPGHRLTEAQFIAIYPIVLNCLETVLIETRAKWKSDDAQFVNGHMYERGVQITVRHSDTLLCQALLRESLNYFQIVYGNKMTRWLNWKLRYSKFNKYNYKLYGPNVRTAAASVFRSKFITRPFWTEALLRCVVKRKLLESALQDLHGFTPVWDTETATAFEGTLPRIPSAEGLFIWHTFDQPSEKLGSHARGCSRFEVLFNRRNKKHRGERSCGFYKPVLPEEYYHDPDYRPF